ncbi:MAG: HEPN domain-containing protein [Pirellulales bacterium]|nr:HEPN domain-containing protein [Pirellulales bacterium]MBL7194513.1 HEPN domain-containing protein [Pirellulales bacterium]
MSAPREFRARNYPNYDDALFFSQQCIEKYLKARLAEAGQPISRTHDLAAL